MQENERDTAKGSLISRPSTQGMMVVQTTAWTAGAGAGAGAALM